MSNRVSRRQATRWNQQADDQAYEQQQQYQQQQYQQPPPQAYAPPPAPAAPATGGAGDMSAELERLANLRNQGILSDEEFAAAKAKVLGL